jgi:hypothetical protein
MHAIGSVLLLVSGIHVVSMLQPFRQALSPRPACANMIARKSAASATVCF